MIKKYLEAGKIVSTHGLKGEVRFDPWCDSVDFLKKFKTLYFDDNGSFPISVISVREQKNVFILKLKGVDTIDDALKIKNKILFIKRDDAHIPDGKYFIAELIGCNVFDEDDKNVCYGKIADVSETGANDVWHIKKGSYEYLIPAIPDVVKHVDVVKNEVIIKPLKGIFEDEN